MFITQGGVHSVEEAILNGIPVVGIPFMVDQPKNVKNLEKWGAAIRLDHRNLSADILRKSILDAANDHRLGVTQTSIEIRQN